MNTSTSGEGQYEIKIDLSEKFGAGVRGAKTLIQKRQYDLLKQQVVEHLAGLAPEDGSTSQRHSCDEEKYKPGDGWSFFIDGTRGAGKSTFLTWIKDHIAGEKNIEGSLHFVACIDPSRIERAEIMLLVILERLKACVDRKLRGRQDQVSDERREDWHRAFKKVAGGLSLLGKDYHPLDGHDPDLFLDWGLERIGNSTHLRSNLHALLDTAREILGVKALMFAFDDADTDSTHGVAVLECIRKYLDAPIVMVLVTGDLELYSLLLRQNFADTVVGERKAAVELQRQVAVKDRSKQYLKMINHLEEQYLLKLFPIERRIQLRPIWNLLKQDEKIFFQYHNNGHDKKIAEVGARDLIEGLIHQGMRVKSSEDVKVYADFVLKQPIRSVLQLVRRCLPSVSVTTKVKKINSECNMDLTEAIRDSLQALALTSLYKFSIDTDAITVGELPALAEAVFDLSIEDGDIDTAMYLRPMSADPDIKAAFTALAAEVPRLCSAKPHVAISYLLRANGSISLFGIAQRYIERKFSSDASEYVAQFKSYAGIGRAENTSDWARRATAIIAQPYISNNAIRKVFEGVVGLRKRKSTRSKSAEEIFENVISNFLRSDSDEAAPSVTFSLVNIYSGQVSVYASIFNIIGSIERLLSSESESATSEIFVRAQQVLTISPPRWGGYGLAPQSVGSNELPDENSTNDSKRKKFELLAYSINEWVEKSRSIHGLITPSAVLMGKIWTRLFFSLANAAQDMRQKNFNSIMEIFACCTINAFLIEEAEHHLTWVGDAREKYTIDRTNPRTSAQSFCEKLLKMNLNREHVPLTSVIATCPLILGLLDRQKPFELALQSLFPEGTAPEKIKNMLCPEELWQRMEGIAIAGGEKDYKSESAKPNTAK